VWEITAAAVAAASVSLRMIFGEYLLPFHFIDFLSKKRANNISLSVL
jgi:hypothetical protein